MTLTNLTVIHASDDYDGTLIFGFDGAERVLALVTRTALDDYFGWPRPDQKRPSLRECHTVVDRNLAAIEPLIQEKYARGDFGFHKGAGATLRLVSITAADLPRGGRVRLTDSVLEMSRAAGFVGV